MSFTPGQRWHSLTEPELGLGRVDAVEGRQVVIAYPARDVVRRYSTEDPPLARARLAPGQQVRGGENLSPGQIAACEIVSTSGYDLVGVPV